MSKDFSLQFQVIQELVRNINPVTYAKTRNMLDGDVTRLSPYITRGVISLPYIRDTVLKKYSKSDSYKLIQELAWREYFQKKWITRGDDIFTDLRFDQEPIDNVQIPQSVIDASTGIHTVDETIKELYITGYMHNHARLTVASLCCNLGQSAWRAPSQWMYYHLLDGDPASNSLSWQWVAGTTISKKYFIDQSLINHWSQSNQSDTFLEFNREQTLDQDKPSELHNLEAPKLETTMPDSDNLEITESRDVFVYHPFHLDPTWQLNKSGARILLLDPNWFSDFSVSEKVMNFIINLGKTNIQDLQVFVGTYADLVAHNNNAQYHSREHPYCNSWKNCQLDERQWLFPQVTGYYKSFFAFWKECEKYM